MNIIDEMHERLFENTENKEKDEQRIRTAKAKQDELTKLRAISPSAANLQEMLDRIEARNSREAQPKIDNSDIAWTVGAG